MKTLFKNIKELLQIRDPEIKKVAGLEMKELPSIKNAWLLIENDKIVDFGTMENFPEIATENIVDASGKLILPSWCDSHTHIVYAGNRELEFADRINGLSYEEIANRGGGILNSAKTLQETPEDEVYLQSADRLEEVMKLGTGAVEIKSGYGLTEEGELKMLRVIKKLQQHYDIPIKSTFLGAHAIPTEYKRDPKQYMGLVINEILPKVADQNLAEYIDIFCEKGYFSIDDTHQLLSAAKKYGMKPKIHVNQFHAIGGIKAGVEHQALSVDHLEVMTNEDIEILKNTETMPVALPSCSLFLSIPYTPARKILDAELPIALATDFNPGSTPSGNMNLVLSLACIKMKMTPEEAINAATINGAYAMELSDVVGSITKGKKANLIMTKKIPSYTFLPYAFGSNNIDTVYINGKAID